MCLKRSASPFSKTLWRDTVVVLLLMGRQGLEKLIPFKMGIKIVKVWLHGLLRDCSKDYNTQNMKITLFHFPISSSITKICLIALKIFQNQWRKKWEYGKEDKVKRYWWRGSLRRNWVRQKKPSTICNRGKKIELGTIHGWAMHLSVSMCWLPLR